MVEVQGTGAWQVRWSLCVCVVGGAGRICLRSNRSCLANLFLTEMLIRAHSTPPYAVHAHIRTKQIGDGNERRHL